MGPSLPPRFLGKLFNLIKWERGWHATPLITTCHNSIFHMEGGCESPPLPFSFSKQFNMTQYFDIKHELR
jgi:hypothetical protein